VVNTESRLITPLTGSPISGYSFSALSVPVRAMLFACASINVLRMIFPLAMLIPAFTGAIFTNPLSLTNTTSRNKECFFTSNTNKFNFLSLSIFYSFVLTFLRAIFSSPIFYSRFPSLKGDSALRAYNSYHAVNYNIKHGIVQQ